MGTAEQLAGWATALEPDDADLALAHRSLVDTVAVAIPGVRSCNPAPERQRSAAIAPGAGLQDMTPVARWAACAHVLDFDDLHMASTSHVSAVCVPATLAVGGDARAFLAGAGVMARLGTALGWPHYARGWHATCTAGAPGAAVAAAMALGADAAQIATAMALAVPAAGGVQRAFGTAAKSLQVGFAADAGVRAARLAMAGASADPRALDDWLVLVGGDAARLDLDGPAVPGGLAIKLYPCCYALQRPIAAARELRDGGGGAPPGRVLVRTPHDTLQPLIHDRPRTGLEGKFSLQYGIAAALLDERPGLDSFTDAAVTRPEAQELLSRVVVEATPGGGGLLAGHVEIEAGSRTERLQLPPGAPGRPPSEAELAAKVADCAGELADEVLGLDWAGAPALLERQCGS
jgi:2-methylcitrate dehydratase PrpD